MDGQQNNSPIVGNTNGEPIKPFVKLEVQSNGSLMLLTNITVPAFVVLYLEQAKCKIMEQIMTPTDPKRIQPIGIMPTLTQ